MRIKQLVIAGLAIAGITGTTALDAPPARAQLTLPPILTPQPTPTPAPTPGPGSGAGIEPAGGAPADGDAVTVALEPAAGGWTADERILPPFNLAWSVELPTGTGPDAVLVRGDALYVASARGAADTVVEQRALGTGRRGWVTALGTRYVRPPVIAGDRFVIQAGRSLVALDLATGQRSWAAELDGTGAELAPLPGGDVLVAESARTRRLDGATGAARWERPAASAGSFAVVGGAAVRSSGCERSLLRLDAAAELWRRTDGCAGGGAAPAIVRGHQLLLRGRPPLDVRTGDPVPGPQVSLDATAAVVTADTLVQTFPAAGRAALTGTDLATGRQLWRRTVFPFTRLVAAGPAVYAGAFGTVEAFAARTGQLGWRGRLRDIPSNRRVTTLTVARGRILVGGARRVQALEPVPERRAPRARLTNPFPFVETGQRASFAFESARLGLAGPLAVATDAFPFKRFGPLKATAVRALSGARYGFSVRARRGTRVAVALAGAREIVTGQIVVVPKYRLRASRGSVRLTVGVPAGTRIRGRTTGLYRAKRVGRRLVFTKITAGRLSGSGRTFRARLPLGSPPRNLRKGEFYDFCVKGIGAFGLGALDGFDRRCGAKRITV